MRTLAARSEHWPLTRPFRISRGEKTAADVVVAELRDGDLVGQGECVPYARYGETIESVLAQIASADPALSREGLQAALPDGAARNAVDCAMWDLEAKRQGRSIATMLGRDEPGAMATAVTVVIDTPERMAAEAALVAQAPLIKVKVNASDPVTMVRAVREAAPSARLIVDPNEGWTPALLLHVLPELAKLDIALIEQPIPAAEDAALEGLSPPIPICADESAHTRANLAEIARRYQAVNIKLDKTGGLTEALAMEAAARTAGLKIMIGCMVCTSLAILPALLLAQNADFVDLDGPWWLKQDRADAIHIENGVLTPPLTGWGKP